MRTAASGPRRGWSAGGRRRTPDRTRSAGAVERAAAARHAAVVGIGHVLAGQLAVRAEPPRAPDGAERHRWVVVAHDLVQPAPASLARRVLDLERQLRELPPLLVAHARKYAPRSPAAAHRSRKILPSMPSAVV